MITHEKLAGVCRVVPAGQWEVVREHGLGLAAACMAQLPHTEHIAPGAGLGPVGEVRLLPGSRAPTPLPWRPSHAVAFSNMDSVPGGMMKCRGFTQADSLSYSIRTPGYEAFRATA